jgi:DTW domain-containing protein YfiP
MSALWGGGSPRGRKRRPLMLVGCGVVTSRREKKDHMATSLEALERLCADVANGSIVLRSTSESRLTPRERLLARIEALAAELRTCDRAEILCAPVEERVRLQAENTVAHHVMKLRSLGACLACTIKPCMCSRLSTLRLSHRLWVVMHAKEALRTSATGKLLLLAHPHATLLVSGVPAHDEELARVASRSGAVVLWPSADACSPAELLREAVSRSGVCGDGCESGEGGHERDPGGMASPQTLDIIVLDGTWNQARHLHRTLPGTIRKVVVDMTQRRSVFGVRLRRQGVERVEAGRVSTLEAYAALMLQLGDDPKEVDRLGEFQAALIAALPQRRPLPPLVDGQEPGEEPPPMLARSKTNQHRRRARSLLKALGLAVGGGECSERSRADLGSFIEARRHLWGSVLRWRVDDCASGGGCSTATLVVYETNTNTEQDVASWPVGELLCENGLGCRSIRNPVRNANGRRRAAESRPV